MLWNYLSPENKVKLKNWEHKYTSQNVIDALKNTNYVIDLTILIAFDLLEICGYGGDINQLYRILTSDYNEID